MSWNRVHEFRQWRFEVAPDGAYRIINPGADGEQRFFTVVSGQYGEPIVVPEPELAFALPPHCRYVNAQGADVFPDQKISGLICRGADGQVTLRVSLTNAKAKGLVWSMSEDGVLTVEGRSFVLYALVVKDRNRFRNYDAFFRELPQSVKPDGAPSVRVLELEDLV